MTHLTPEYFSASGACSLLEPQPKFLPPTKMTPGLAFFTNSVSKPSSACFAKSLGSTRIRYLPGKMTSVSMLLPNFMALALILALHYAFASNFVGSVNLPVIAEAATVAGDAK